MREQLPVSRNCRHTFDVKENEDGRGGRNGRVAPNACGCCVVGPRWGARKGSWKLDVDACGEAVALVAEEPCWGQEAAKCPSDPHRKHVERDDEVNVEAEGKRYPARQRSNSALSSTPQWSNWEEGRACRKSLS